MGVDLLEHVRAGRGGAGARARRARVGGRVDGHHGLRILMTAVSRHGLSGRSRPRNDLVTNARSPLRSGAERIAAGRLLLFWAPWKDAFSWSRTRRTSPT